LRLQNIERKLQLNFNSSIPHCLIATDDVMIFDLQNYKGRDLISNHLCSELKQRTPIGQSGGALGRRGRAGNGAWLGLAATPRGARWRRERPRGRQGRRGRGGGRPGAWRRRGERSGVASSGGEIGRSLGRRLEAMPAGGGLTV